MSATATLQTSASPTATPRPAVAQGDPAPDHDVVFTCVASYRVGDRRRPGLRRRLRRGGRRA